MSGRRRLWLPLATILVIAFGSLAATLAVGNTPELGLDLQGGASVVLQPPADVSDTQVIDQAIEVIRQRVDALGVSEPDITRQGDAIVVELPGVADQERALEILGQTAELRFRPVRQVVPPPGTPGAPSTTVPLVPTPREEDVPEADVTLPGEAPEGVEPSLFQLGPAAALGRDIADAQAVFAQGQTEWSVLLTFTDEGIAGFNELASACFNGEPTCARGAVAIVLDGTVVSSPTVREPTFPNREVTITGNFDEEEAKDLALVLRYGSLPVQLEQESVQTVSPTLGADSLRAGLLAGALGTALVLIYLLAYYRALGLVVMLGLGVWAALQWSVISYLGSSQGLALSLAGVTGIIVSVGVTVDSYIVYFERLRDEVRAGRSVRSSVDRSFKRAFRTILAADTAAFIGAFLLWWLTVGAVRGFAFFLGLSTVLDLVVAYFFTRPMVAMLSRRKAFVSPRFIGVTPPEVETPVRAPVGAGT
ncbi:MAG TPA: protein translocase subunit SecD [Acidimicrobiales bacterium]|nr:protein translocase subunit SecD [Acidimicrobiales bacterium]